MSVRKYVALASGVALAFLASIDASAQALNGPTFDCSRAQSALSQSVCREPSTWEADWALSAAYWAAYFSVEGTDRTRLRDGHVAWLKTIEDTCGTLSGDPGRAGNCVAQRYRARANAYKESLRGDALAEASLRPGILLAIQSRLIALGFMGGAADGVFGSGTRQAIRAYRQTLGHAPSDFLDPQERATLLRGALADPGGDARRPFGETVQVERPTVPDPRFARDPFEELGGRSVRVNPGGALQGIVMGMLNGVPQRRPTPGYTIDRSRETSRPYDSRSDGFDGPARLDGDARMPPSGQPRPGGRSPGSEFSDGNTAVLAAPLAGRMAPEGEPSVRTVEVTGTGETPDAARKDAARLAIQQVAGVFIDNRRRVELNVSDKKVSEVVDEKLISYTNAYVSKMEVVRTEQKGGLYEVGAKVGVAIKPLLKVLQDNAVPVVAFDTATGASTAETLGQEKTAAVELYADLVSKADTLLKVGVGTPQVDASLPSSAEEAWIRVPLTYSVNDEAAREWRAKFDLIAQKRTEVVIRTERGRGGRQDCSAPALDTGFARGFGGETRTFLSERTPQQQQGVAACFATYPTPGGVAAECLGRTFVTNETHRQRCPPEGTCLRFEQRAERLRLFVEFLDKDGAVIFASRQPFRKYPSVPLDASSASPNGRDKAFFNFCVASQDPFFAVVDHDLGAAFGNVLIFPPKGSKIRGYLNLLVPNSTVARIASVRARIARDAT